MAAKRVTFVCEDMPDDARETEFIERVEVALRNRLITHGMSEVTLKGRKVKLADTELYDLIESDEGSTLLGTERKRQRI